VQQQGNSLNGLVKVINEQVLPLVKRMNAAPPAPRPAPPYQE